MIWGMSLPTFTLVHVLLSLFGIASGFTVMGGMLAGISLPRWTLLFLLSNIATSVTGFGFPTAQVTPAQVVGIIALLALLPAVFAVYARHLDGSWRMVYVVSAGFALYLNVFVSVVQAFGKIPALKEVAPTQAETPFVVAQTLVFLLMILLSRSAWVHFRPASVPGLARSASAAR